MQKSAILNSANELLDKAVIRYNTKAIGTVASLDTNIVAPNYAECFVRDFVSSALVFLMRGEYDIVRNFLTALLDIQGQQKVMSGHEPAVGLMPASFKIWPEKDGSEKIIADFGDLAIGRVAPVDSALWWFILLRAYIQVSGDSTLVKSALFQNGMRLSLRLYLKESFETSPAMLVPDGSFMIDRRMGVYGHPLEIQSLFYGMLLTAKEYLLPNKENSDVLVLVKKRVQMLRSYIRLFYWIDIERLNEIHRYRGEEFGLDAVNLFNIYPDSIPAWMDGWLSADTGFFVGNLGPGRIDFRLFSLGNLLAILFNLATEDQAQRIMRLYDKHWDYLIGKMPLKICYPAKTGQEWALATGSDPKNVAWSYHNGGHWPALLWPFVGAAIKTQRIDLAERALNIALERLAQNGWPEYYDGQKGSLIGRRANLKQIWSVTSYLAAQLLIDDPENQKILQSFTF